MTLEYDSVSSTHPTISVKTVIGILSMLRQRLKKLHPDDFMLGKSLTSVTDC